MKKNFSSTLVLGGVLALVVAWYFGYEKKIRPDQKRAEEKQELLLPWENKEITELEIVRTPGDKEKDKTQASLSFKRAGNDDWNIVAPIEYSADSGIVSSMIGTIVGAKRDRVIDENPKDYDQYGLKTPYLKVKVGKGAGSPPAEILIGSTTPVGSAVFVKLADSPKVYRTAQAIRINLDKDLKAVRNKEIFKVTRGEIEEVEIQNPKETILLKKGEKDQWLLPRENLPVDPSEWNKTLNAIVDLKAKDFPDTKTGLSSYKLQPPSHRITLNLGKGEKDGPPKRLTLLIGNTKDKVYLKHQDKPTVFEVEKDFAAKLDRPSKEYRNMKLAQFNRFEIKRVQLERGKEILEILKSGPDWTLPAEPNTKVDGAKVDALLTAIQDSRVQTYSPLKSKIQNPKLLVRLMEEKDGKEREALVLKFGPVAAGIVPGERSGLDMKFELKSNDFARIDLKKSDLILAEKKELKAPDAKSAPELIKPDGKKSE